MKFRKKPVVIEAVQWFSISPDSICVRPFANIASFQGNCSHCKKEYDRHGFIETLEGGYIVCPGDWIIKGINGEFYPVKDEIFRETYYAIQE